MFPIACMFFYNVGRFTGIKESSLTVTNVTNTFKDIFARIGEQHNTQIGLLTKIIEAKDTIIASFSKENTEMREALEEISSFNEDDEDADDEDDLVLEDDAVSVGANKKAVEHSMKKMFGDKSPAHTALQLHEQLQTSAAALESIKNSIPLDAYALLKATLMTNEEKKNVN